MEKDNKRMSSKELFKSMVEDIVAYCNDEGCYDSYWNNGEWDIDPNTVCPFLEVTNGDVENGICRIEQPSSWRID